MHCTLSTSRVAVSPCCVPPGSRTAAAFTYSAPLHGKRIAVSAHQQTLLRLAAQRSYDLHPGPTHHIGSSPDLKLALHCFSEAFQPHLMATPHIPPPALRPALPTCVQSLQLHQSLRNPTCKPFQTISYLNKCLAGSFPTTPHGYTSDPSPQPSDQLHPPVWDSSSPSRATSGQHDSADGHVELLAVPHGGSGNGGKADARGGTGKGGIRRSDTAYDSMDA